MKSEFLHLKLALREANSDFISEGYSPSEDEFNGRYVYYYDLLSRSFNGSECQIRFPSRVNKGNYEAAVVLENSDYQQTGEDWSVVKINSNRKFEKLIISSETPKNDEKVFAVGFPLNEGITDMLGTSTTATITEGNINNVVTHNKIPMSCNIDHGNSGGPLVNAKGKVIGINTWGLTENKSSFLNFAVRIISVPYQRYVK